MDSPEQSDWLFDTLSANVELQICSLGIECPPQPLSYSALLKTDPFSCSTLHELRCHLPNLLERASFHISKLRHERCVLR